jgi:hypothetical protein
MLSYNYCHFEASKQIESDEGQELTMQDIDKARMDCQVLANKAIEQYKKAKEYETQRANRSFEKSQLEKETIAIKGKPESEWSPLDKAKIKALEDHNFESRFYDYYEDKDDYGF